MAHVIFGVVWTALAALALVVQMWLISYSVRVRRIAKVMGDINAVYVMAHARFQSNLVRLIAVSTNLAIGVAVLTQPAAAPITILGIVISLGFTINELCYLTVALLELHGHRRLRSSS